MVAQSARDGYTFLMEDPVFFELCFVDTVNNIKGEKGSSKVGKF